MKFTKFVHACMVLEQEGRKLIIDPGMFSDAFGNLDHVDAVVVSHDHIDHLSVPNLQAIVKANPDVKIYLPEDAADGVDADLPLVAVTGDLEVTTKAFSLTMVPSAHAEIYKTLPRPSNLALTVNDGAFYYPGDSWLPPVDSIDTLAFAVGGPWVKVSEAIDFVLGVAPGRAVAVHDAVYSDAAHGMLTKWFSPPIAAAGIDYLELEPGHGFDIASI